MSDPDEIAEPLQSLPAGMARRYAEYMPVNPEEPKPPPTNVGGYDDLLEFCRSKGLSISRSRQGLVAIDSLIESAEDKASLEALAKPIGMFFGDVLTHTIPGAHWKVINENFPEVSITRHTSVSVVHVAQRRLEHGIPTLVMNYDRALDLIRREPHQSH
ncbi:DUF6278 family protein [Arthrobacter subterraneus]|uniref:DUF6278 family protein n=1 Tax=Arthrobacter subterraneus TaxID=335973 RepID=UPI0038199D46